jgi:hypothetical protein
VPVLAQFVEFENSAIVIDDTQASSILKFRLKSRPDKDMNVYIHGAGLILSSCKFTFTPANYYAYQTLALRSTPIFAKPGSATGQKTVSFRIFNSTAITQNLVVTQKVARGYSCSSTGDPHLNTFDDQPIELQKPSPVHLFRSADLNIQAIQMPCGSPMCNYGIAVRYGRSTFIFDYRGSSQQSPPAFRRGRNSLNDDNVFVSVTNGAIHIILPDGSVIRSTPQLWSGYYFGNIVLSLSARQLSKSYGGTCNRPEGAKSRLYGRYGQSSWPFSRTNAEVFAASWTVLDDENLFRGATKDYTIPDDSASVQCIAINSEAAYSEPKRILVDNVVVAPQDVTVYNSTYVRPNAGVPNYLPPGMEKIQFAKEAEIYCKSQFDDSVCLSLVDPYPYVGACIMDALITGDHGFSRGHKLAFLENCAQVADSLILSSNSQDQEKGRNAIYSAGLYTAPCTKACEKNGICTDRGCQCNSGWYGMYCEHSAVNHTRLVNGTWERIYKRNITSVRKCRVRTRKD